MKEIDFALLKDELTAALKKISEIVVSTSCNDIVTSRTVFCSSDGSAVYFITSRAYTKYKQIVKNPNVALCRDNIQITGRAEILGHPSSINLKFENEEAGKYISHYSRYKNTVMIKVVPAKIVLYRGKGIYDYCDLETGKAMRKGRESSE
ncbi:MAG TPA: hypothetical protein PKK43_17380 [Spirochaetota bacterium]|nr:hypothetical protein [Spirochaetota bacterium]